MNGRAIFFALVLAPGIMAQSADGFAFRVHVVDSVTGASVVGANVVVLDQAEDLAWGRTDLAGLFTGRSRASGKHLLTVTRRGYRMTGGSLLGKLIEIQPGSENNIAVEMLPLGVIAGRVLDQYGDPVRHAIVRAFKERDPPGQGQYEENASLDLADDRGEYRLTDLEPGRYYVAAEYSREGDLSLRGSRFHWPEIGGFALLPDVTDIRGAQKLEVSTGGTTRVTDLRLTLRPAVTISGHVKPVPQHQAATLMVERAGPRFPLNVFAEHSGTCKADGSFAVRVLAGTYVLTASDRETGKTSAAIKVEVHDKEVSNVELAMDTAYEIAGRIRVDGPETMDFSKIHLTFHSGRVEVGTDGSFHAKPSGSKVQYLLQGLPEDWYLESVTVGGQRLLGNRFEVRPGTTEVLFTLNAHGAQVEATISSGDSMMNAVLVLFLPETAPVPDVESMINLHPDQAGRLLVRGLPPGRYRVFALDAANWAFAMNPGMLMQKHGKSAPLIEVAQGEHKSIIVQPLKVEPQ